MPHKVAFSVVFTHCVGNALISEGDRKSSVKVHFCHRLLCSSNLDIERIMGGSGVISDCL